MTMIIRFIQMHLNSAMAKTMIAMEPLMMAQEALSSIVILMGTDSVIQTIPSRVVLHQQVM